MVSLGLTVWYVYSVAIQNMTASGARYEYLSGSLLTASNSHTCTTESISKLDVSIDEFDGYIGYTCEILDSLLVCARRKRRQ